MSIVWVLEPQHDGGWEMGPQCVTKVALVASRGGRWYWVWGVWGENGGKRVVFWVLEPQDAHSLSSRALGWEMGPQCVTEVGGLWRLRWGGSVVLGLGGFGVKTGGKGSFFGF